MNTPVTKLRRHIFIKLLMREYRHGYLTRNQLRRILRAIKSNSTDAKTHQMTQGSFRISLIWAMWRLADESPVIFAWGSISLIPSFVLTVYVIFNRLVERI